ncbi:FhuF 2Fe-2S C-terminal domain-containing protein [Actinokineospora alba]|uniref:FhuF 2Fe-2S C-terminal domain-containing protein n=1 Tax=Actinokineospora alba TaxID=504798 RepID=A0A1H0I4S9_9PSEU|nr:(2Fe-2S)-binding protein [Actinokineospora alba]TDP64613.1 FhuF-like iron-sulfur protein [Actinokineospora alba]SDI85941.1 FhuF 2Fe-2S C-terminal domain-containing protein [Actinokineospora alba]SDO26170.1 FhuF 2Fe-2S C-terminal domain-containing protein [Actinokineospora alba]
MDAAPISLIQDAGWLSTQLALASRRYRTRDEPVLGVLWWYSASLVLLGPVVESSADPASVTLLVEPDGRVLSATASSLCTNPGPRLREVISASVGSLSGLTGASERALWAITTDSLANRVLWASGRPADAVALARAVGPELPVPRFVEVGGRTVVRRASCCLVYETPGADKCVSCPRQTPADRMARLARGV